MVHLYLEGIPGAPPRPWECPPLLLATCTPSQHGGPKSTFGNPTLRSRAGSSWPAREQSCSVLNFSGCFSFSELLWFPLKCVICHSSFSTSTLSQKWPLFAGFLCPVPSPWVSVNVRVDSGCWGLQAPQRACWASQLLGLTWRKNEVSGWLKFSIIQGSTDSSFLTCA